MSDPSAFLSTIAATSAAMVAIVGGLLVARFVSIASEQEGAQRLLDDAQGRLDTARRREQEARANLRSWYINDFFEMKVIRAIGEGEHDVRELRKVGSYTALANEELAEVVKTIVDEFETASRTLEDLISGNTANDHPMWEEFKHAHPLPQTNWGEAWEIAYENIVWPRQPAHLPAPFGGLTALSAAVQIGSPTPPEYDVLDIQRADSIRADVARAKQHLEDAEAEFARLQRTRDAIVRPKGLGWGLVVLGFFTLVGVIIPIWLMSRAPDRLTAHLGEVVFWLFFTGLLALLGYMSALALRLSGWRKRTGNRSKRGARNAEDHGRRD